MQRGALGVQFGAAGAHGVGVGGEPVVLGSGGVPLGGHLLGQALEGAGREVPGQSLDLGELRRLLGDLTTGPPRLRLDLIEPGVQGCGDVLRGGFEVEEVILEQPQRLAVYGVARERWGGAGARAPDLFVVRQT